jgi:cytoskeletal protein RodZ
MTEPNLNPDILKESRESKGLTLEIVHEATKIPLDALKAIEQGYSVRILTPFYYRGFIKIYAEFLGLNVQDVFKAYNLTKSPSPVVVPLSSRTSPSKAGLLSKTPPKSKQPMVEKPNPLGEGVQEFLNGLSRPHNRNALLRGIGILLALFILFKIGGCVAGHFKGGKPKSPVVKVREKRAVQPVTAEMPAAAPVESQTVAAHSTSHKVQLVVRAMKDSWIQVKTDGEVAFSMTMHKGTMESWTANDQIELSGRNINELEMEVNGKQLGSLGSAQRRAKRVVITKDGLTVKK